MNIVFHNLKTIFSNALKYHKMNNNQSAKFKMYQSVEKVCREFATDIATKPIFKTEADEFVALIPEIRRIDGLIGDDRTVVALTKNQVKDSMIDLTIDVSKNIRAVGLKTNDETLKAIASTSVSALSAGKEEMVLQRCQRIATKAREILTALNERGMASTLLDELDEAIEVFKGKKPEPQHIRKEKSALIAQLGKQFETGDSLLELMALTLPNFKKSNPDFFNRFEAASVIETPITKTTKGKFLPENETTGDLLTNFNVAIPTTGFSAFINGKDNPSLEIPHHRDAQIVFTKEGFEMATLEHEKIVRGQMNRFVLKMKPIV